MESNKTRQQDVYLDSVRHGFESLGGDRGSRLAFMRSGSQALQLLGLIKQRSFWRVGPRVGKKKL